MAKRKYRTGYCLNKQCEGTSPLSFRGDPMPTCKADSSTCGCQCHVMLDEMFKMVNMERVPQHNPKYNPEHVSLTDLEKPVGAPLTVPSILDGVDVPSADQRPVEPRPAPATVPPTAPRTPTGRRARGGLEGEVLKVCLEFAADVWEWEHCLPKLIAERVQRTTGNEAPSTGAIGAVFDRWEKLGFAEQGKKPVRFVQFLVPDPSWETLERMKLKTKREKKRARSDMMRGVRRP